MNHWLCKKNFVLFCEYQLTQFIGIRVGAGYSNCEFYILSEHNLFIDPPREILGITNKLRSSTRAKDLDEGDRKVLSHYVDAAYGAYNISALHIPIILRIYPVAGNFCINFGFDLDFVLGDWAYALNNNNISFDDLSKDEDYIKAKASQDKSTYEFYKSFIPNNIINRVSKGLGKVIRRDETNFYGEKLLNRLKIALLFGIDHTTSFGLIFGLNGTSDITDFINYDHKKSDLFYRYGIISAQINLGLDIIKTINFINSPYSYSLFDTSNDTQVSEDTKLIKQIAAGICINFGISRNYTLFCEYKPISHIGIRVGIGYSNYFLRINFNQKNGHVLRLEDINNPQQYSNLPGKVLKIIDKLRANTSMSPLDLPQDERQILGEYFDAAHGIYDISALYLPIILRIYPFSADFCINFGIDFDFILGNWARTVNTNSNSIDAAEKINKGHQEIQASRSTRIAKIYKSIVNACDNGKIIKNEEVNFKHEKLLTRFKTAFIFGVDYTTSFGLMIGYIFKYDINKGFINFDKEMSQKNYIQDIENLIVQINLGLDIIKIINLVNSTSSSKKHLK